jgi:hypothetical protein
MLSLYGYEDINHWVYGSRKKCLCDNWQCIHEVGPMDPMPCIAEISSESVRKSLDALLSYLNQASSVPKTPFQVEVKNSIV